MSQLVKFVESLNGKADLDQINQATMQMLIEKANIRILDPKAASTVVFYFMQCAFQYLNEHKSPDRDISIDFGGMFEMGVTNRIGDEDEEKDGNFVPYLIPGHVLKSLIKSDEETEDEE